MMIANSNWIPAFAGMTANENTGVILSGPVIPAKAGIQTKQSTISNNVYYRRDIPDTVGKFMESLFCRPYGTDPDVYMSLIPAVNYWAIISSPYGAKKA